MARREEENGREESGVFTSLAGTLDNDLVELCLNLEWMAVWFDYSLT